jgi:hypothetical protein
MKQSTSYFQQPMSIFFFIIFLTLLQFNAFAQGPVPYQYSDGTWEYLPGDAPDCMKNVSTINISTGCNFSGNPAQLYPNGALDAYWTITSSDMGGTVPRCASIYDSGNPNNLLGSRKISVVSSGNCNDNGNSAGNLAGGSTIYTFTRYFWVDAPVNQPVVATLQGLTTIADDKIKNMYLNGNNLGINSSYWSSGDVNNYGNVFLFGGGNIFVHGGLNSLQVEILSWKPGSGGSAMYLQLEGIISVFSVTNQYPITNKHFVPNTPALCPAGSCATNNKYLLKPEFSNLCIGQAGGTVTITNYEPSFTYSVSPSSMSGNGFQAVTNQSYTVTVKDGKGCTMSSVAFAHLPSFTQTIAPQCMNLGTSAALTLTAQNGVAPYQFSFNGAPYAFSNYNSVYQNTTNQYTGLTLNANGTPKAYPFLVKDSKGCEFAGTAYTGPVFSTGLTVFPSWCPGVTSLNSALTASPPSTYPFGVNYAFSGPQSLTLAWV